jgi:hypothetical protein
VRKAELTPHFIVLKTEPLQPYEVYTFGPIESKEIYATR